MEELQKLTIANKNLKCIELSATPQDAHNLMTQYKIRHLLITEGELAIGVLSDRDVMRALRTDVKDFYSVRVREEHFNNELSVCDLMGWPICYVRDSSTVEEIIDEMLSKKISSLLVLNETRSVIGIVTTDDLLLMLKNYPKVPDTDDSLLSKFQLPNFLVSPIGKLIEGLSNSGI